MKLQTLSVKWETKLDVPARYAYSTATIEAAFEVEAGDADTPEARACCYERAARGNSRQPSTPSYARRQAAAANAETPSGGAK